MNNLNTILVEGTLTRDPLLKNMTAESYYCRLSIANNRYYADKKKEWKQDTSYFLVYVFGPVADVCAKYLKKGRGIRVVGRLKQNRWTDSGIVKEAVYIVAEHIEFQPERKPKSDDKPESEIEIEKIPGQIATTASFEGLETEVPDMRPKEGEAMEGAQEQEVEQEVDTEEKDF